jgi:hypothetical protein
LAPEFCYDCGASGNEPHDDECVAAEHQAMLAGDEMARELHDPEECEECLVARPPVLSDCRCGNCCRSLLIEVSVLDSQREPKIRKRGSPIYQDPRLTASGQRELIGYMLNSRKDGACVFLDRKTNLCTIHATRPLICRLFDCDRSDCRQLDKP